MTLCKVFPLCHCLVSSTNKRLADLHPQRVGARVDAPSSDSRSNSVGRFSVAETYHSCCSNQNIPNIVDRRNPAIQERCASDIDYLDGLE
jgi:hypothetical protein